VTRGDSSLRYAPNDIISIPGRPQQITICSQPFYKPARMTCNRSREKASRCGREVRSLMMLRRGDGLQACSSVDFVRVNQTDQARLLEAMTDDLQYTLTFRSNLTQDVAHHRSVHVGESEFTALVRER
jgi:hypothetical protein